MTFPPPLTRALRRCALAIVSFVACEAAPAWAHSVSDSHLSLDVVGSRVTGEWRINLRDLDVALRLDEDGDGRLSDEELERQRPRIASHLSSRLALETPAGECPLSVVEQAASGLRLSARLAAHCSKPPRRLAARYELFFEIDVGHRGRLSLTHEGTAHSFAFRHDVRRAEFTLETADAFRAFTAYVREGVFHIWVGYDHLLFLLTLLLPAALVRRGRRWQPTTTLREALAAVARVVSAFTLSHSLTLCLAALGWVHASPRWVEAAIAASVALAALNNLWPVVTRKAWLLAFAFGLVHGLGFAGVLGELGLGSKHLAVSLVGFNLGVELGQLVVVALLLPPLYLARNARLFQTWALRAGSVGIACVGFAWAVERSLERPLLSGPASAPAATLPARVAGSGEAERLFSERSFERARVAFLELRDGAARDGDAERLAAIDHRLGDVRFAQSHLEAAIERYEQAARGLGEAGALAAAARSHRSLAAAARVRGDLTHAARALRAASQIAERLGDDRARADDAEKLAKIYRSQKRFGEAEAEVEAAREARRRLADEAGVTRTWLELGHVRQVAGDLPGAQIAYDEALSGAVGNDELTADAHANLGNVARRRGQRDQARRHYSEALAKYQHLGDGNKERRVHQRLRALEGR